MAPAGDACAASEARYAARTLALYRGAPSAREPLPFTSAGAHTCDGPAGTMAVRPPGTIAARRGGSQRSRAARLGGARGAPLAGSRGAPARQRGRTSTHGSGGRLRCLARDHAAAASPRAGSARAPSQRRQSSDSQTVEGDQVMTMADSDDPMDVALAGVTPLVPNRLRADAVRRRCSA